MRLEEQQMLATGDVTMILYKFDEQGNEVPLKEETFRNMIMRTASVLMARRMAPGTAASPNQVGNGFQFLALGTGVGTGTQQNPQASVNTLDRLRTEIYRKAITSWTFLDSTGVATTTATNILELTTEIPEGEAIGALTEMGLFGGEATTAAGTGYLFNHKVFPVWNKPNDARLKIIWKITF